MLCVYPLSYHKLVDVHASIDGNFAPKVVFALLLTDATWCLVTKELGEALHSDA